MTLVESLAPLKTTCPKLPKRVVYFENGGWWGLGRFQNAQLSWGALMRSFGS
jgi:hypothetical protein